MDVWTHDRWRFPLPGGHRFPIDKYALLRERLVADGVARPGEVHEAEPAPWEWLAAVHDAGLLERIRHGRSASASSAGSGCRGRSRWSSARAARSAGPWRRRATPPSTGSA